MVKTDGRESLSDIDETLASLSKNLHTDEYGNRMNWKRREEILTNIDALLDARLVLIKQKDRILSSH
jgi:hypothetical protein